MDDRDTSDGSPVQKRGRFFGQEAEREADEEEEEEEYGTRKPKHHGIGGGASGNSSSSSMDKEKQAPLQPEKRPAAARGPRHQLDESKHVLFMPDVAARFAHMSGFDAGVDVVRYGKLLAPPVSAQSHRRRRLSAMLTESDMFKLPVKLFEQFLHDSNLIDTTFSGYCRYLREAWHSYEGNRLPDDVCTYGCGRLAEFRGCLVSLQLSPAGARFLEDERERFMNRIQQQRSRQRRRQQRHRKPPRGSGTSPSAGSGTSEAAGARSMIREEFLQTIQQQQQHPADQGLSGEQLSSHPAVHPANLPHLERQRRQGERANRQLHAKVARHPPQALGHAAEGGHVASPKGLVASRLKPEVPPEPLLPTSQYRRNLSSAPMQPTDGLTTPAFTPVRGQAMRKDDTFSPLRSGHESGPVGQSPRTANQPSQHLTMPQHPALQPQPQQYQPGNAHVHDPASGVENAHRVLQQPMQAPSRRFQAAAGSLQAYDQPQQAPQQQGPWYLSTQGVSQGPGEAVYMVGAREHASEYGAYPGTGFRAAASLPFQQGQPIYVSGAQLITSWAAHPADEASRWRAPERSTARFVHLDPPQQQRQQQYLVRREETSRQAQGNERAHGTLDREEDSPSPPPVLRVPLQGQKYKQRHDRRRQAFPDDPGEEAEKGLGETVADERQDVGFQQQPEAPQLGGMPPVVGDTHPADLGRPAMAGSTVEAVGGREDEPERQGTGEQAQSTLQGASSQLGIYAPAAMPGAYLSGGCGSGGGEGGRAAYAHSRAPLLASSEAAVASGLPAHGAVPLSQHPALQAQHQYQQPPFEELISEQDPSQEKR